MVVSKSRNSTITLVPRRLMRMFDHVQDQFGTVVRIAVLRRSVYTGFVGKRHSLRFLLN